MPPFGLKSPLVLAPMCDFLELGRFVDEVGPAELYHIEYTRVHASTNFEDRWLNFINELGPKRRVIAQLLGNDLPALKAAAERLQTLPIAGVDLNVGCPAPKIYKGNVGGGLLRDLETLNAIIGTLREAVKPPFTFSVKFRLGFEAPNVWPAVMEILRKHGVDWTTVHFRTVSDGYRGAAHHHLLKEVVASSPCPVLINGDIHSAEQARDLIADCGAWGAAVGRASIRYPWIFRRYNQPDAPLPTYADAFAYYQWVLKTCGRIGAAKGYLNFLGLGVEPTGKFLKLMRGVQKFEELEVVGREWIASRGDEIFPEEPYDRLYARPSMERPNPRKDPWLHDMRMLGLTPYNEMKAQLDKETKCGMGE